MKFRGELYDVALNGDTVTITDRRSGVARSLELPGETFGALAFLLCKAMDVEGKSAPPDLEPTRETAEPSEKKRATQKKTTRKK